MSSIMPNLAQKFGWSPLGRAVKIARKILEQKTGKQEVTFREVSKGMVGNQALPEPCLVYNKCLKNK